MMPLRQRVERSTRRKLDVLRRAAESMRIVPAAGVRIIRGAGGTSISASPSAGRRIPVRVASSAGGLYSWIPVRWTPDGWVDSGLESSADGPSAAVEINGASPETPFRTMLLISPGMRPVFQMEDCT